MRITRVFLSSIFIFTHTHASETDSVDQLPRIQITLQGAQDLFRNRLLPVEGIKSEGCFIAQAYVYGKSFLRIEGHDISQLMFPISVVHEDVKMIYLDSCGELTKEDYVHLGRFKNLEYLRLCNVGLTDNLFVTLLEHLPGSLRYLDLGEARLSDESLLALGYTAQLMNLHCLYIWDLIEPNMPPTLKFTEKGICEFAHSPVGAKLDKVFLSAERINYEELPSKVQEFYDKRRVSYPEFYDTDPRSHEIYMLHDPMDHGFVWDYHLQKKWFLNHFSADQLNSDELARHELAEEIRDIDMHPLQRQANLAPGLADEILKQIQFSADVTERLLAAARRGEVEIENLNSPTIETQIDHFLKLVRDNSDESVEVNDTALVELLLAESPSPVIEATGDHSDE